MPIPDNHPIWQTTNSRGKFEGEVRLTRELWDQVVQESGEDDSLSSEGMGYYALVLDYDRDGGLPGKVSGILHESTDGFVSGEYWDDAEEAKAEWDRLAENFPGDEDDDVDYDDEDDEA